jgi:GTPase SAR1 family protein
MSDEQPQPRKPPRREIEASTGVWPRSADEDERELLEPPPGDRWHFTPDYGDEGPDGYAEQYAPEFQADGSREYELTASYDPPPSDVLVAPEFEAPAAPAPAPAPQPRPTPGASPVREPGPGADPASGGAFDAAPAPADVGQPGGRAGRSYRLVNPDLVRAEERAAADEDWAPEPGADMMRIGIWGPPASGKTTYLAAIKHDATNRAGDEIGTWKIIPRNEASEQLLTQWTQLLVEQQEFPEATPVGGWSDLRWHFIGDLSGTRYTRRRLGMFGRPAPTSEFDLELIDVSGEAFGYRPTDKHMPESTVRRTLAHLAGSDGLVFLFDPITERDRPSVATYVERVLNNLSRRILNEGRMVDGYLPHHIAICVTKTDSAELVEQARRAGLVNTGPDGIDRVLNGQAEALFNAICAPGFWANDDRHHGGAGYVRNQLRTYFHPKRTRYYAISAIGHQNLATRDGVVKITGPIRPYNVLQPLVELHMQLRNQG